jgi:peroxiredoxin
VPNEAPSPGEIPLDKQACGAEIVAMVAVNSTMLPLGTRAPDFRLPNPEGVSLSLADFKAAPALLVVFMCNHCPYVKHIRDGLARLARDYRPQRVAVVGINSNDVANYPADSPARMAEEAASAGYVFPYLYDESQAVAKAYHAACTPDFYLFDQDQRLVYRGQFDDSRPGNGLPVTGKDLRAALDAVLSGRPVPPAQKPSIGCNIKWKPGNEPDYF